MEPQSDYPDRFTQGRYSMSDWPHGDGEIATRIRGMDWATTALGPVARWSERLKLMVEQVLASPLVSSLVCGPKCVLIYNDAAAKLYGDQHPAALGRPLPDTFPEGWATVAPFYERAFTGESVIVTGQPVDTRGEGDTAADVFDAYLTPVHEAGAVAHVHAIGIEIGERSRAEARLRASEERFQHVVRATRDIVWDIDLVADRVWWSEALQTELGFAAEDIGPDMAWCFAHMHPNDRERVIAGMKKAAAGTDSIWSDEFRYQRADGTYAHIADRGFITRDASGRALRMTGAMQNITVRNEAEAVLRESEARQAFLLGLSDALSPLSGADETIEAASRLLAEYLEASRVLYFRVEGAPDGDRVIATAQHVREGKPFPERVLFDAFHEGAISQTLEGGGRMAVADSATDARLSTAQRRMWLDAGVGAAAAIPLVKNGRMVAIVGAQQDRSRDWTAADMDVIGEVAERTWVAVERARAEVALRESEERFRGLVEGFGQFSWEAGADGRIVIDSPGWRAHTGQSPDAWLGRGWVDAIHPDDQVETERKWSEAVTAGSAVDHEYRLWHAASASWRWSNVRAVPIRSSDGSIRRWTGVNIDVADRHLLLARQKILVNELQHRARNLLAVVRSIADRTVRRGGSVDGFEVRLQALSRAQGLLSQAGSDKVEVGALVRAELAAHADSASEHTTIRGPEVYLTAQQVQNFALALHELTTNAVKYGALKADAGHLLVTWEVVLDRRERRRLALSWIESGVAIEPDTVTRRGYGTELIQEALAYALRAKVGYELGADGVSCRIEMPVS